MIECEREAPPSFVRSFEGLLVHFEEVRERGAESEIREEDDKVEDNKCSEEEDSN